MNLTSAKPGDLVLIDRRGDLYYAEIRAKDIRHLSVRPLNHRLAGLPSFQRAKSREVVGLWLKSRQGLKSEAKSKEE